MCKVRGTFARRQGGRTARAIGVTYDADEPTRLVVAVIRDLTCLPHPVMAADSPTSDPATASSERPDRDHTAAARALLAVTVVGLFGLGFGLNRVTEASRPTDPDLAAAEIPVPDPGGADDFARDSDGPIGVSSSGDKWRIIKGGWVTDSGRAAVADGAEGVSLALLPVGAPNATISVTADVMAPGLGLAFRCRNAGNCWRLEAVPDLGTWNLIKAARGIETEMGNLGIVPIADGTTVSVFAAEDLIVVSVDGEEALTVRDPEFREEGSAGLSLREPPSAAIARWSDFIVEPYASPGLITREQATLADDFDRDDAPSLGVSSSGAQWRAVSGSFAVVNGRAVLSDRATPTGSPSVALVDAGDGDGVVQITMLPPQTGTGVAFRCRDADNCMYLTAGPGFATWNLAKRIDGVETRLASLPLVSTAPGLAISVELSGNRIDISVNGDRLLSINDPDLVDETGIGLIATEGAYLERAKWSQFLYAPLPGGAAA